MKNEDAQTKIPGNELAALRGQIDELNNIKALYTQAGESLRKHEEQFLTAFRSSSTAKFIARLKDLTLIDVNEAFERLTRYRREEAIGCSLRQLGILTGPENRGEGAGVSSGSGGVFCDEECQVISRDGNSLTCWCSAELIEQQGEPCVLVMLIDLTGQKRVEDAIKISEAKYRQLHESMMDAFACTDMTGRFREFNETFREMLGYQREELLALDYLAITPDKWHPAEAEIIEKQVLIRGYSDIFEKEYRRKNGAIIPVELRIVLLRDQATGTPAGMWAIIRDITSRKKAEESRRQSDEKFAKVFRASPSPICISRFRDGSLIDVNAAFEKLSGYCREEIVGRSILELNIWPDPSIREHLTRKLVAGDPVRDQEFSFRAKNGELVTARYSAEVAELGGESCVLSVLVDITGRKQTEEALRQSEIRYRTLFESAQDSIFLMDGECFVDCNPPTLMLFRCKREQILGKSPFQFSPPRQHDGRNSTEKAREKIQAALRGIPQFFEWQHSRLDGTTFDAEVSLDRLDIDSRSTLLAIVRDITGRKQAEETLQQQVNFDAFFTRLLTRFAGCTGPEIEGHIQASLKDISAFFDTDNAAVIQASADTTWSSTQSWYAPGMPNLSERYQHIPLGSFGWIEQQLLSGREIRIDTLDELPPEASIERHRLENEGLKSLLIVPLRGQGNIVRGCIGLRSHSRVRKWSGEDVRRLRLVGDVIANVLERQQAEEEVRRRNRELSLLNNVMAATARDLKPAEVLDIACRELSLAFELPRASAFLLNQNGRACTVVARYTAPDSQAVEDTLLPVFDNPLIQFMIEHKHPVISEDVHNDPRLINIHDIIGIQDVKSLFALPLVIEEETAGGLLLSAVKPRSFSREELNLAWNVTGQVAGALSRARLGEIRRRLMAAIEQTPESTVITGKDAHILYVNPAFERVTGYSRAEVEGQNPRILNSGKQDPAFYLELWSRISKGHVWRGRFVNRKKDGTLFTEDAVITPVNNEAGEIENYIAIKRDITRELEVEEQYRHMQKLDSIGRLAGGVAHDLNNILTIIFGHSDLALRRLPADHPARNNIEEIWRSAEWASRLTRQLLAFARCQIIKPCVFSLNELVLNLSNMLRRIIGENIQLVTQTVSGPGYVKADSSQIEQVLLNLVINARDAMPDGGTLIISTGNSSIDSEPAFRQAGLPAGDYLTLCVSDTGSGIAEEVREHIFEPFFTTKEQGKGTGLGLATCFGIIKQNRGHIFFNTEVGRGTSFKIYLPRVVLETISPVPARAVQPRVQGGESILIVEDELYLRLLLARVLREQGYYVLEAANGREALSLVEKYGGQIQLLISDMIMPEMNGQMLAGKVCAMCPGIKVIYTSGYVSSPSDQDAVIATGAGFLHKPFTPAEVARKVQEVLDTPK